MKVGLYNIEPKIQNTALMQISHYHKERGDQVEWYEENLWGYDKVYCSSLFDFTDKSVGTPVKSETPAVSGQHPGLAHHNMHIRTGQHRNTTH